MKLHNLKDKDFASLWVFEINHAADLYRSLGFIETGDSKTIREVMTTDEIREELGLDKLGTDDTVEQDVKFSKVGMIDGQPVFSTIEEAEAQAKAQGCTGYHEHELEGQTRPYMYERILCSRTQINT